MASSLQSRLPELSSDAACLLAATHPAPPDNWWRGENRWSEHQIGWQAVMEAADQHGVLPLLYRNLKKQNEVSLPPAIKTELSERGQKLLRHNLLLSGELVRLSRAFDEAGLDLMTFKGPLLAQMLYGDLSLRQYVDLDILVRVSQLMEAKRILAKLGYHPHIRRSPLRQAAAQRFLYEEELVHETHLARVDLHWGLTASYARVPKRGMDLWTKTISLNFQGVRLSALPPREHLLYLCQHGSKHGWQRLVWIADVALAAGEVPELEWPDFLARAGAAKRMLLLGLNLAYQLWGIRFSPIVHKSIQSDPSIGQLTHRVFRYVLSGPGGAPVGGLNRKWFYCRILEGWGDRTAYLMGRALTPNEPDWNLLPLPRPLFFLYVPLRIFRLAMRGCREMLGALFGRRSG